jgi:DNA helicase II / ATP-dependent DNA helicase PcrA
MKPLIPKKDWQPVGITSLEENASNAVRFEKNQLVMAGPGAGKTELLAQRACYLLQTGICPSPRRILAISFKRDSAQNLKDRVEKRCGKELSRRFDSVTFDAFAKSLLDRFMPGLPMGFRPKRNYKVQLNFQIYSDVAGSIDRGFAATNNASQLNVLVTGYSLPISTADLGNLKAKEMWETLLNGSKTSHLTFPMISRLTELIINQNTTLCSFLQKTYAFVFLDEFQDTTSTQYDLLKACFYQSNSILTAVGDDRQRIMGWAGALPNAFIHFRNDFAATEEVLNMNYRSAPRLVEVQKILSNVLLGKKLEPQARPDWQPQDGIVEIWRFNNYNEETARIVSEVKQSIEVRNINPRDICILVKQQLPVYANQIIAALNAAGINARNEDKYQALLTEEVVQYLAYFLFWILNDKALEESRWVMSFYAKISNAVSDREVNQAEREITSHMRIFRKKIKKITTHDEWKDLVEEMINCLNYKSLVAYNPDYRDEEFLQELVFGFFTTEFIEWLESKKNPTVALDCILGKNSVPVLTIHKSKGLEYHTVLFVGLEDGAFWNFSNQPEEDKCAFFVAASRAKQRVVFTFSDTRLDKYGNVRRQNQTSIAPLYQALHQSGLVDVS